MIAQICEMFTTTPDVAMRQDMALCLDIGLMRRFARTWDKYERDRGTKDERGVSKGAKRTPEMTDADWEFLEWADKYQDAM